EGDEPPSEGQKPCCRWLFAGLDTMAGIARNCFGDANALVRRSVFFALDGFTEDRGVTHEDWEFFARAMLHGYRLEVVPHALFWSRPAPGSMPRPPPPQANYARSLRPYLEEVPGTYQDLIRLAQGQSLRIAQLEQRLEAVGGGRVKPLRYRAADAAW